LTKVSSQSIKVKDIPPSKDITEYKNAKIGPDYLKFYQQPLDFKK
jgi:hypothetical protein